jgi:hypothetical protein
MDLRQTWRSILAIWLCTTKPKNVRVRRLPLLVNGTRTFLCGRWQKGNAWLLYPWAWHGYWVSRTLALQGDRCCESMSGRFKAFAL